MILTCTQVAFLNVKLALNCVQHALCTGYLIVGWWRWFLLCLGGGALHMLHSRIWNKCKSCSTWWYCELISSWSKASLNKFSIQFDANQWSGLWIVIKAWPLSQCMAFHFVLVSIASRVLKLWRICWSLVIRINTCICFLRQQLFLHWILLWNDWHAVQLL